MTYRCENDKIATPAAELLLLVAFALCLCVGTGSGGALKWIANGAAVVLAVCAMNVADKYILTKYIYVLDDSFFKIYGVRGKRSVMLANIPYADCLALARDKTTAKSVGRLSARYRYVPSLFSKGVKTLYFTTGDAKAGVDIAAPPEFCDMLRSRMSARFI